MGNVGTMISNMNASKGTATWSETFFTDKDMQKTLQNVSKIFPLSSFIAQKVEFQSRIDGLKQYMELRSVENKLQGLYYLGNKL